MIRRLGRPHVRRGQPLALALALPEELPQREQFIAMCGGVVLATLLLNATTIPFVVHMLGLEKPSRSDEYLNALSRLLAVRESRNRLRELNFEDPVRIRPSRGRCDRRRGSAYQIES